MPSAPLIFMDTETTGLEHDADIWEFAAIRREPDGSETELHLFIEHDEQKCRQLPESFLTDHLARFPGHGQEVERRRAAHSILGFTSKRGNGERPHIVGAVPNFDTERIEVLIRTEGIVRKPEWHYHLIDVENLAVGYLRASSVALFNNSDGDDAQIERANEMADVCAPPWDSDALSRAVRVDPDDYARHTAMGDVEWARDIYDSVMGDRA